MKLKRKGLLKGITLKEKPKKQQTGKIEKEVLDNEDNYQNQVIGEVVINSKCKTVVSTCRSGELGLPHCDIRLFTTTEKYTGPTKSGIRIPLNQLGEIINYLCEVENIAEENGWYEEWKE